MVKVLEVLAFRPTGGVGSVIMNFNDYINHDKIQINTFFCDESLPNKFDDNIKKYNGDIFTSKRLILKNFFKIRKDFEKIISLNNFDVIHLHSANLGFIFLPIAKRYGVKKIIVHSHNVSFSDNLLKSIRNKFLIKLSEKYVTDRVSCGIDAGKSMFKKSTFTFIPNGINVDKFTYNESSRKKMRDELSIPSDMKVLGMVGRLASQKNCLFSLNVMKSLNENYKLVLVGSGPEEKKLKKFCKKNNLCDKVIFLGNRSDISEILSLFDLFLIPSLYEGFPVSILEASANGLKVISSSSITRQVNFGNVFFEDLNYKNWVSRIVEIMEVNEYYRKNLLDGTEFDIINSSKKIEDLYLDYSNTRCL